MNSASLKYSRRWPWLLLIIPVLVGFARLKVDVEMLNLLPSELSVVRGLVEYQQHFASSLELIVTVSGAETEVLETAAEKIGESLRGSTNLVKEVSWRPAWLEAPTAMGEFLAYAWLNQPPERFQALAVRLAVQNAERRLLEVKDELATSLSPEVIGKLTFDPFGITELPTDFSAPTQVKMENLDFGYGDETLRIIFVEAATGLQTYKECQTWLNSVREIILNSLLGANLEGRVRIAFTGRPAFVAEIAKGMESDLRKSVIGTVVICGAIFYFAHRRWKPLLWVISLLGLIVLGTLGLGGLFFGEVNIISLGFAAILIGLGIDYALVQYHEALGRPSASLDEVRRAVRRGIFGAATTSVVAFLSLNLCGLPGLAELGTLVALGVGLSAVVMYFAFLPPLMNKGGFAPQKQTAFIDNSNQNIGPRLRNFGLISSVAIISICAIVLGSIGFPGLDSTAKALRPSHSSAYATLEDVQRALKQKEEPVWIVVQGHKEADVASKLALINEVLEKAKSDGLLAEFFVPISIWPNRDHQQENRPIALELARTKDSIEHAALKAGFNLKALALLNEVLSTWQTAASVEVYRPNNAISRGILEKFTAQSNSNYFALALVGFAPELTKEAAHELALRLPQGGVWLTGWRLLGSAVFEVVKARLWIVGPTILVLALIALWFTFRRVSEVLLSCIILLMSSLCLLAIMRVLNWEWNLMNLVSIPIVLGTGVDYSILTLVGLRRFEGDRERLFSSVGKALLLCAGTSMAGFGSLGLSSNTGIASLGPICAVGIGLNMILALALLPSLWGRFAQENSSNPEAVAKPSSLYRSGIWSAALWMTRFFPVRILEVLSITVAALYRRVAPRRYRIVLHNLLPVFAGNESEARKATVDLFRAFARKLVHLWRYEGGFSVEGLLKDYSGWEHLEAARATDRGVLLVTVHLGNWELGAAWLAAKGIDLRVITMAEPGETFTRKRQAARARRGISTLVVGTDPFGSLEVIRRLQEGACVALLIDRPPSRTAVEVSLFGNPFPASIAAAELARASGCVVLPVYVAAMNGGYTAHILSSINYERAALRTYEGRRHLTQQIMRAFEPVIRQHANQWYHFVPVWSVAANRRSK